LFDRLGRVDRDRDATGTRMARSTTTIQ
jgi:hypothetical protein